MEDAPAEDVVGQHAEAEDEHDGQGGAQSREGVADDSGGDGVGPVVQQPEEKAGEEQAHGQGEGHEQPGDHSAAEVPHEREFLARFRRR